MDQSLPSSNEICFKKDLAESMSNLEIQTPKFKSSNSLDGDTILDSKTPFEKMHNECVSLQKAQSVPHLTNETANSLIRFGSTTQRKKTSEASSIPESLLHAKLVQENQSLKEKVTRLEEEKTELVKINNIWNTDYTSLKQRLSCYEKENSCLKEDLNNRDKHIKKLTKKLEVMFVANSEEKSLWDQLKSGDDEDNDVRKDTPTHKQDDLMPLPNNMIGGCVGSGGGGFSAMHQFPDYQQKNQELQHQNNLLQKRLFDAQEQCNFFDKQLRQTEYEIQRMSAEKLNPLQKSDKQLSTTSLSPSSIDAIGEVEILRHQLKVYAEDFRIETEEKKKLLSENIQLKKALSELNNEQEHLRTQLKIYEDDFHNERDKRVKLMNMIQSQNDQQQSRREWQEYYQLMQEKDRINDRIKKMENHGVPFNASGRSSSMSSASRPLRNVHPTLQQQLSGPPSMPNHAPAFVDGTKPFLPTSSSSKFQPISSSSSYMQPHINNYHQPRHSRHQQTSPMPTYSMMSKTSNSDRYRHLSSKGGEAGNGSQAYFGNHNSTEENIKGWLSTRENKYIRTPSESSF